MNKCLDDRFTAVRRLLCLLLAFALTAGLLPADSALAAGQYGRVNFNEVRFRKQANTTDAWALLDSGWVVEIRGEKSSGGTKYYYVVTNLPKHLDREYYGYISQQYITPMTAEEVTAWQTAGGNALVGTAAAAGTTGATAVTGTVAATGQTAGTASVSGAGTAGGSYVQPTSASVNYYSYNGSTLSSLGLLSTSSAYYVNGTATIADTLYYIISVGSLNCYVKASNMMASSPAAAAPVTTGTTVTTGTAAAAGTASSATATGQPIGTVRITPGGVTNMRSAAHMLSGNVVATVKQGAELPYYYTVTPPSGNHVWYYCYDPVTARYGFIVDDCVKVISSTGSTNYINTTTGTTTGGALTTAAPLATNAQGYIRFTAGGVNLRKTASTSAKVIGRFDKNEVIPYYGTEFSNGRAWYLVRQENEQGYVLGDFCEVVQGSGTVVVTPAPNASTAAMGYVMTTADKVYVRKRAGSDAGVYGQVKNAGTVLPIVGTTVRNGNVDWYCVSDEGNTGYIHGRYVTALNSDQNYAYQNGQPLPTATPAPTAAPQAVSYIQTIADKVWIRKAPSTGASTKGQAGLGAVFYYTGTTRANGADWYKIDYAGESCYIMAKYCRVMTDAELAAYQGQQPAAVVTAVPSAENLSNLAVTNTEKVIVRASGASNGKQLALLYRPNQVCTLLGPTNASGGYTWYNVRVNSVTGWIRGDLLRILTKAEAEAYNQTGNPNAQAEASYSTLQLGSTGTAVVNLQNRLVALGYLNAINVTGVYDTTTRDAVLGYQRNNGLTADGIAGSSTQHKLFGTAETGTNTASTGSIVGGVTLYKPELIDWNTGGIQNIFYKGCTAVLTDVRTGISFQVRRWSGGDHADVEPLTAADTAAMCRVYGVSSAQEISDKNLYQRHPVLVTLNGHSYAASMYGVPHNYPDGDTIPNNNFNGQFCIHFVNSRVHRTNKVDSDHQRAIMYAYENAATLLGIR